MEVTAIFSRFVEGFTERGIIQTHPKWIYKAQTAHSEEAQKLLSGGSLLSVSPEGIAEFTLDYFLGPVIQIKLGSLNSSATYSAQNEKIDESYQLFSGKQLELSVEIPHASFNSSSYGSSEFYHQSWVKESRTVKPWYYEDNGPSGLAIILGVYEAFRRNIKPYEDFSVLVKWNNSLIIFSLKEFHEFRSHHNATDSLANKFLSSFFSTYKLIETQFEFSEKFKATSGVLSVFDRCEFNAAGGSLSKSEDLLYNDILLNESKIVDVQGIWLPPQLLDVVRYEIARCILWHSDSSNKMQSMSDAEQKREQEESRRERNESWADIKRQVRSEMYSDDPNWHWNID